MHLVHGLQICCRWSIIIIASMCCISVLKATRHLNQTSTYCYWLALNSFFSNRTQTQKCSQQRPTCRGLPQSSVALGEDHTVLGTLWLFNTGFCWNEGLLSLIGENLIMGKEEKDWFSERIISRHFSKCLLLVNLHCDKNATLIFFRTLYRCVCTVKNTPCWLKSEVCVCIFLHVNALFYFCL